jgi:GNAT superfamily N-acetyltransferase
MASKRGIMIEIRPYRQTDHAFVRALFVRINRDLSPPHLRDAFEAYIARSLEEEIDRIPAYYTERQGGFWVAEDQTAGIPPSIIGMFGLEQADPNAAELRRMYVDPGTRRRGLARAMLARAEAEAIRLGCGCLVLSTSELQGPALALYRSAGYRLVREEVATGTGSNKTVGAGLKRFHFEKSLTDTAPGSSAEYRE